MDDTDASINSSVPAHSLKGHKCWQACLNLDFSHKNERTYLAKNLHLGPLVLQKTLHPEGGQFCHGVIIHPPGGVAGGDALMLNVTLNENSNALLTTPGAGKWYKANSLQASQHLRFNVHAAACLEWLPQENILFDGADVKLSAEVSLAADAQYVGWEIICFGRQAQLERWQSGVLHQGLCIRRGQALIWNERTHLKPEDRLIESIVGLHGNAVSASFVIAAGAVPASVLAACRAIQPKLALDLQAKYSMTALPEIFAARYVGQSAQCARQYFEALWKILRPWYAGREVTRPRIWNT
jgi:urease accessory protein